MENQVQKVSLIESKTEPKRRSFPIWFKKLPAKLFTEKGYNTATVKKRRCVKFSNVGDIVMLAT